MIEWHGSDVLNEIGRRVDENMMKLGHDVVAAAEGFAPRRTGRLATSIGFDYSLSMHTLVFTVGAEYGIFVEYGTRNMLAHPYLRPALNSVGPIYGFNTEMVFMNTPLIRDPLLAAGPTFRAPKNLTAKQREHVKHGLKITSKRLWEHPAGNVRRSKMRHVRTNF